MKNGHSKMNKTTHKTKTKPPCPIIKKDYKPSLINTSLPPTKLENKRLEDMKRNSHITLKDR